jgi:hypothetical protein
MPDPYRVFYQQHLPDLSAITDLPHRHFRFLLPCGSFLKLQDQVRSGPVLGRWLVRYRPSDVYYSTSCWLVPASLGRRERTPLSDNIFLASDIVFDLDRAPFSVQNLELARRDTLRLLAFCDTNRLAVKYIAFSGSKGFHVVCADSRRYDDPSPLVREDMAKAVRKEIVGRVLAADIPIDTRITGDTRRIIRVPGTINSKTGYVCTVISRDQLACPVGEILKYIPRVNAGTPRIPGRGDDRPLRGARIIPWLCHRLGVRSEPTPRFSYATYLVNTVGGTPLQVPFFSYPPGCRATAIENVLRTVQEQYGLTDIYLYRSGTAFCALSLGTFPIRRLEKIIKASGSSNFGTLVRYRQLFFRVGEVRDDAGRLVNGPPEFVKTLPAPGENNCRYVSRPHHAFLQDFIPGLPDYPRMHGEGSVLLTHTVNEVE